MSAFHKHNFAKADVIYRSIFDNRSLQYWPDNLMIEYYIAAERDVMENGINPNLDHKSWVFWNTSKQNQQIYLEISRSHNRT